MNAIAKRTFFDRSIFTIKSSVGAVSLFSLMLPLLFESIMNSLQGTVNTAILSGYSENAAAAVGAANTVINVILLFGTVIAMGSTIVISNSIGAENIKKASEISFTAILVSIFFAFVITPVMLLASGGILRQMNLDGEIYENALIYFRIRLCFFAVQSAMSVLLALLKCYGYPKYTFLIGLLTNAINLLLNIYVIHFPQIPPVTGVSGVALACCCANIIGLIATIVIIKNTGIKLKKPCKIKTVLNDAGGILKLGIPSGLSSVSFTLSQMITTSFVALLGDSALSAKVYFTNILSYVYLFSFSAGSANALLIGRRYGAGEFELADKMNMQLTRLTRIANLIISLTVIALRRQLLGLFTGSEAIIAISLGIFAADIVTEQARAISHVYEYALRAAGDVFFSMIILIISCWTFSIGLAYILAIKCGLGLIGCWIGLAVDESVRAAVTYIRWKCGKWKYRYKQL